VDVLRVLDDQSLVVVRSLHSRWGVVDRDERTEPRVGHLGRGDRRGRVWADVAMRGLRPNRAEQTLHLPTDV
jgi:hypothetical protein